jgi:hypothetical protein
MAGEIEELDLISAVWILACNDENHLLTFEGVKNRLGLSGDYDARRLVLSRRELFRPGAPPGELNQWKADMRAGRRLPGWIREMEPAKRDAAIDALSEHDVFRSQVRSGRGAPVSDVQIVNWGLDHLDRLRQSRIASREAEAKSWQMWLVFGVGVANILMTIVVALMKG